MRHLIFTILIIAAGHALQAQEADSSQTEMTNRRESGQHELKFNMGSAVFELLELNYEYIINKDIGIGMAGAYNLEEFNSLQGMVLPYFRFYTAEEANARGLFFEANTGLIFSQDDEFVYDPSSFSSTYEEKNRVGFGLGFAVGGKFVSKRGLFGEVYGGVGREFNDESFIEFYPRAGLNFGYRF